MRAPIPLPDQNGVDPHGPVIACVPQGVHVQFQFLDTPDGHLELVRPVSPLLASDDSPAPPQSLSVSVDDELDLATVSAILYSHLAPE